MTMHTGFTAAAAIFFLVSAQAVFADNHCQDPSRQWSQIENSRDPFGRSGARDDPQSAHYQAKISDDQIYGHEIMTRKELRKYRKALRRINSDDGQLERFQAEHRDKMQQRASELGVELEDGQG
jgi:hypothetical protein